MTIRIEIDDHVISLIRSRWSDLDMTPMMEEIAEIGVMSVRRNFEAGGRPKWAGHSPSTIKRRGVGARVLIDRGMAGGLMGSIHGKGFRDHAEISANKEYAATMHFGARKGEFGTVAARIPSHKRKGRDVRGHTRMMRVPWGHIPARPFMSITDSDKADMMAVVGDYFGRLE
jgi:phage gpG-like protein